MRHSRPGFAVRTTDDEVAALNADMIPAIHRAKTETDTPLKKNLQSKADHAFEKLKAAREAAARDRYAVLGYDTSSYPEVATDH